MNLKKHQRGFLLAPYRFTTGPAGDPYWANVVALLHFDGADESTTFVDQIGNTTTVVGNAQIDTSQAKFGGASGRFDGSGDALRIAHNAAFNLGSASFTIECWVRFASLTGYQALWTKRATDGASGWLQCFLDAGQTPRKLAASASRDSGGDIVFMVGTTVIEADTWYHVAFVRDGSIWRLFVNGVQNAATTAAGTVLDNSTDIILGAAGLDLGAPLNGWLDDFRLTPGVARYTAAFTPPTSAFPNS